MKKSFKAALVAVTCLGLYSGPSFAITQQQSLPQSYQVEVNGLYGHVNADDDNTKQDQFGVIFSYYFSPVNTSGHPLAEAAFMERAGVVNAGGVWYETKYPGGLKSDGPQYLIGALYASPSTPLVASAQYERVDFDYSGSSQAEYSITSYQLGIGMYLTDGLRAMLKFESIDSKLSGPTIATLNGDEKTISLEGKWVKEQHNGHAFNLEAIFALNDSDDDGVDETNTLSGVAGDYYLTPAIGVGAIAQINSGDDKQAEGTTLGGRVRAFLHPQFSVVLNYQKFSAENQVGQDVDLIGVILTGRL